MKTDPKAASPLQAEKDFRAFLRSQGLLLKSMKLCNAWPAVLEFHRESIDKYAVLTPEGEGLTFDAHLGKVDRGVRFEVAINRLFRLTRKMRLRAGGPLYDCLFACNTRWK